MRSSVKKKKEKERMKHIQKEKKKFHLWEKFFALFNLIIVVALVKLPQSLNSPQAVVDSWLHLHLLNSRLMSRLLIASRRLGRERD